MGKKPEDIVPAELKRSMHWFPEASAEERGEFFAAAADFLSAADPAELRTLPPLTRVKWHFARERRADELLAVLRFEREYRASSFRVAGKLRPRVDIPGVDLSSVPSEVTALHRHELPVQAKATEVTWRDGQLVVLGYAFVRNLPVDGRNRAPRLAWLRQKGSRRRLPIKVRQRTEPRATRDSGQALHCYDQAGFEIVIDPSRLRPGQWQLTLALPGPGGYRLGQVDKSDIGSAGHSQARALPGGNRLVAGFGQGCFGLTVSAIAAEISGHELVPAAEPSGAAAAAGGAAPAVTGAVRFRLRTGSKAPEGEPRRLLMEHKSSERTREYPLTEADGGYTADVPVADLAEVTEETAGTEDYLAWVEFTSGATRRAVVAGDFTAGQYPVAHGREIAVTTDGPGLLKLHDRARQAVADQLSWTADGELEISGEYLGAADGKRLVLRHGKYFEEQYLPFTCENNRFQARIAPERMPSHDGAVPLREGRWYLSFRAEDEPGQQDDVPVKIRAQLTDQLPLRHQGQGREFFVERRYFDRIFLASGSPLREADRGKYRQRQLRERYSQARQQPLKNVVFYNCYHGRQFSDSPRAIYEELVRRGVDVEHVWGTSDAQAVVPDGVRTVEWKSAEWHEVLATSRYMVTNVMISSWIKRRSDQRFIQTWHGTPLKKMGADLLGTSKANPAYIATLPGRFEQFDYMVSPNAFTTPIMRSAFGFPNEILECGYPRNDVFYRADREETADRVRKRLNLPEGKKVLLYTPTWRDDQRFGTGKKFKLDLQLDLAALERELGDEYVLLFRKHPKMLNNITGPGDGFVRDVAAYAEVSDLYLITDVLITDYSSTMFDFAHTGRPMVFFTYDLEHYRDTLRGFYFDFTDEAPGPLLKTNDELIAALRDIDRVHAEHAGKYAAFTERFCVPGDGQATPRVVDALLGEGDGAPAQAAGSEGGPA